MGNLSKRPTICTGSTWLILNFHFLGSPFGKSSSSALCRPPHTSPDGCPEPLKLCVINHLHRIYPADPELSFPRQFLRQILLVSSLRTPPYLPPMVVQSLSSHAWPTISTGSTWLVLNFRFLGSPGKSSPLPPVCASDPPSTLPHTSSDGRPEPLEPGISYRLGAFSRCVFSVPS